MRTIIFYAPLGKKTSPEKIGGAEAGCLKTKEIYEKAGINVIVIDKPALSNGKVRFVLSTILIPFKLFFSLITHPKAVLHVVGFYTKIARFELLLIHIGKYVGHKTIYEVRNGSMIRTYKNGSETYQKILKSLLIEPDVVLCQGMEYVDFIWQQWKIKRNYYPNYIMDNFLVENNTNRAKPIKLIYFGRVTESKNIDIIIETLAIVRANNIEATLDIIGGSNEQYQTYLNDLVMKRSLKEYVFFYGRKPFGFIAEKLRDSHYFIFPSQEKQEGHSNALTEAMGCGVVPIVSPVGFNKSICGFPQLVINDINPQKYAEKIIEIENNNKWRYYSEEVYNRVKNNFTEKIISKNLISYISPLF